MAVGRKASSVSAVIGGNEVDLSSLSHRSLKELCRDRGLSGYSRLDKGDMIALLQNHNDGKCEGEASGSNKDEDFCPPVFGASWHMVEAICTNLYRAPGYAVASGGLSLLMSLNLIFSELAILPLTLLMDLLAIPFNVGGINIIRKDFVSMHNIKFSTSKPSCMSVSTADEMGDLSAYLRSYVARGMRLMWAFDLRQLAEETHDALERTLAHERTAGAAMPMCKHLLESIGLVCINHMDYDVQSGGYSRFLTGFLQYVQLAGMMSAPYTDALAQRLHMRGVGIVENDVPHIPFEAAYKERMCK